MADKTVTARLRTTYDKKGTDDAAKGLRGLGDQAKKTSQTIGRDWAATGQSMARLGDSMTTKVSLPLIGLGALATKAAADFDASFTQMSTLAGVSQEAIAGLKDEILNMAGDVGKSPQELADAYYFLASSGLEASEAMDALEVSAKASAAGLGPTEVIADAVSSAMLGYAESGLEAAEATDVLIATAKAGKAEPAELAAQMGRLIPTAAELGITFADVGGAIAALSTKGNDAAGATTQLTNVMGKLMKPSQQAEEALQNVGLSTERIRELIAEKGLLGTLEVLKERLGDSGFTKFFEDQQAIQGALALTGGDLEKTRDIFEDVNDSVGATDKAFETWAESMGAKNARAFADFQVALIQLGEVIAPIASDIMAFAADVVGGFAKLPEPVQKLAIAFAAILAVSAPLASAGGRVLKAWDLAMKAWDSFSRSGGRAFADAVNAGTEATNNLGSGMGKLKGVLVGGAIAAGIIGIKTAADAMREARNAEAIDDLAESFVAMGDSVDESFEKVVRDLDEFGQLDKLFDQLRDSNAQAAERLIDTAEAAGISADKIDEMRASLEQKRDADAQAAADSEANQEAIEGTTEALADQEQAVNEAAEAFANYADTIKATFDPVFGMVHAMRQNDEAQRKVQESLTAVIEARKEHGRNSAEAREAEIAYHDALLATGEAAEGVQVAAATLNQAIAENPALLDSAKSSLEQWVAQGLITQDQAAFLADQFGITALQATALGETDPTVDVTERGSPRTRTQLRSVRDAAFDIPTSRSTHVGITGYAPAVGALDDIARRINNLPSSKNVHVSVGGGGGAILHEGGIVPGPRGQEVAAVLQAGEEVMTADDPRHSFNLAKYDQPMVSAAVLAGGSGGDTYVFNLPNLITPDSRKFRQMVVNAVNVAGRKGRGLNAA